jgi:hypothetical protein
MFEESNQSFAHAFKITHVVKIQRGWSLAFNFSSKVEQTWKQHPGRSHMPNYRKIEFKEVMDIVLLSLILFIHVILLLSVTSTCGL